MYLPDANVLLALAFEAHEHHPLAVLMDRKHWSAVITYQEGNPRTITVPQRADHPGVRHRETLVKTTPQPVESL